MYDGEYEIVTEQVCQIDWACLFSNIGSPAVWVPLLYGVVSTVVALTPTEADDRVLARIKNLVKKYFRLKA